MKLTKTEIGRAVVYGSVAPKQFGNLHERMKYVMSLLQTKEAAEGVPHDLWHAIYDLETEVKYHEPAKPPYARRTANLNG